ncbi:reverse transcriptase [Hirsutella rhossiliensis]
MRKSQRQETWKCAAVVTDARNPDRIKILCRDQTELKQVKEAAQKTVTSGARRTAVLDAEGNVLPGAAEALGAENYVTIAKITWLSNREKAKALLDGVWFDVAGESACTNVLERRVGPIQCFNCQEMGHKAFSCKKPQRCGRCAKAEHHHRECKETVPKCVPCGGPHESYSRNCRARNPGDETQAASGPSG